MSSVWPTACSASTLASDMGDVVRIYEVKEGAIEAWLSEWRDVVVPLRDRFGFRVTGAWVSADDRTFVWTLEYDGDDLDAANEAYYNSPERASLDPDPARHLENVREVVGRRVHPGP
jgi:hypothetical protein